MKSKLSEEERKERRKLYMRNYRVSNPEKDKATRQKYREEHREEARARTHKWRMENPEKERESNRRRYWENRDEYNQRSKEQHRKYRGLVLEYYGSICACCGEAQKEFLSIDHINGGGYKHRKEVGALGGSGFYRWLINNNYPEGYRVLCHNCNLSLGHYGYCPHSPTENRQRGVDSI